MDNHKRIFTGQDLPILRTPKINSDDNFPPQTSDGNSENTDNILTKSNLSADAKEFFPKSYLPSFSSTPASKSVQSRLARTNVNHVETTPQTSESNLEQQTVNYNELYEYSSGEIEHLREVLTVLTSNPGKFDDTVPGLLENLNAFLNDQPMMECIISNIVEQAVKEHNFGYSGARLCVLLDTYSPFTRSCLLNYCDSRQFQTPNVERSNYTEERNFTLFLAELYSQLDWDKQFGVLLLRMIQNLLNSNQPDCIKCVCQTLKLTGMCLENMNMEQMTTIMRRLEDALCLPNLPSSCANLLKCVLELRAKQWGRSLHQQQQQNQQPQSQQQNQQTANNLTNHLTHNLQSSDYPPESPLIGQRWSDGGPVFYGPDGLELSAEENEFLTDIADEISHDESDPDGLWDPDPEMDEEIISAFKEFVAMTKK